MKLTPTLRLGLFLFLSILTLNSFSKSNLHSDLILDEKIQALTLSVVSVVDESCSGRFDGMATISVSGGSAPYTYSWSPLGGNAATASGLTAGTYTVTVSDANSETASIQVIVGCTNILSTSIVNQSNYNGYSVSCFGAEDGFVELSSSQVGVSDSVVFNYTGTVQYFVVPAGVTSVNIKAWGAQGGTSYAGSVNYGGFAAGDIAVTPGETLYVYVGEQPTGIVGGFNGGGNGDSGGKGGGGASDVRKGGNALTDRIIVAAGAGGGGYWSSQVIYGGVGGGLTGGDGYRGTMAEMGGLGATQNGPGANGTCINYNVVSMAGSLGVGGSTTGQNCGCEGYGGGGGYYGGAASGNCRGGGGGSSYIAQLSNGVTYAGVRAGHGRVSISYNTTPSFTYSWSSGHASNFESNLAPGSYFVTTISSLGCTTTTQFNLTQPSEIDVNATIVDESAPNNGGIVINSVTGGIPPYTYLWNTGETNASLLTVSAGIYTLTVTDSAGCSKEFNYTITSSVTAEKFEITKFNLYPNPSIDGVFNITWKHASTNIDVSVVDVLGKSVPFHPVKSDNHIQINLKQAAKGIYFVKLNDKSKVYTLKCIVK